MRLSGKKAVILVSNEFEDLEVFYPMLRLSEEGAWVTLGTLKVSTHPRPAIPDKPITGRFGLTVPPFVHKEGVRFDIKPISELSAGEYDAVLVPGGFAPHYLRKDADTKAFVRDMQSQGKLVAAICGGPWLLISAGLLNGRRATGYIAIKDDIENAGATFVDEPVVVDGNILCSRDSDDLPDFCVAIIKYLAR